MNTFNFIQATIPHNVKDPHSEALVPDCLSPRKDDYPFILQNDNLFKD